MKPRVVQFYRKPTPGVFGIEHVFDLVGERLPDRFERVKAVSSFPSKGVVPRVRAMLEARRRQGDVNHVVGDVHFLALGLSPVHTVLTIHDCEFMERAGPLKRWIYLWLWLRLPVGRAGVVVVPTDAVREDLRRYVPDVRKVRVIPDPVNDIFSPTPLPAGRSEPVILQVGTRSNKNLERVARALQGVPCRLVVLGRLSPNQRRLLALCGIRYEELVDLSLEEVARCYRDCDLVVFASTKEGFGLPIVEAQASGRPVVTGDRPPLPEVAGGAACLVDPLNVASIRAGIFRVIENDAYQRTLVREGLRNVARFDPGKIADSYAAIYDQVLVSLPASAR